MMIRINILAITLFTITVIHLTPLYAQDNSIDLLNTALKMQKEDSMKVKSLINLSKAYLNISYDTALMYASQAKDIAEKIKFEQGIATAFKLIGIAYYNEGNYIAALSNWTQSLALFESIDDKIGAANMYSNIGAIYSTQGDDEPALYNYLKSLHLAEQINDKGRIATLCSNLGALYGKKPVTYDKALEFLVRGLMISEELGDKEIIGSICLNLGDLYINRKNEDSAILYLSKSAKNWQGNRSLPVALTFLGKAYTNKKQYGIAKDKFKESFDLATKLNSNLDIAQSLLGLANINYQERKLAEAIKEYEKVVLISREMNVKAELKEAYSGLAISYGSISDFKKAYSYMNKYSNIKDTLYNIDIDKKLSGLDYTYNIRNKESQINLLQKEKELQVLNLKKQKSAKNWITIALGLIFIITVIIFWFYRVKIKTNSILNKQNHEINEAYIELKSTQSQLIQSEKMASLGELTAGIAHEIQNPLNFVNNFSELNNELIKELKNEVDAGNTNEVKVIANDIEANSEKINHHGKRAESIVKGMLEHSRKSSGIKEPTDINKLCDEFARLSYHGLRAKDQEFNCDYKLDLDPKLPLVNVVSQDIGRVLLNIFNNAFQACIEKSGSLKLESQKDYKPLVSISTKYVASSRLCELIISDNGPGIPDNIRDKIFQPFFTTKPTGQGTGLGLSLAYDIVKAHSGELNVETREGEGSEFIVQLPIV